MKGAMETVSSNKQADSRLVYRVFSLEDCGINHENFLRTAKKHFEHLEWDYYDVKKEQIDILKKAGLLASDKSMQTALGYYRGERSLKDLRTEITQLPERMHDKLLGVQPYRQKTVAYLELALTNDIWEIERLPNKVVAQDVAATDIRSIPRVYPATQDSLIEDNEYQKVVTTVASFVKEARPEARAMEFTCWQMATVSEGSRSRTNSPEGIHQDGADFIVSALVVNRSNICGGKSRIFAHDKETVIFETVLEPGYGLFQEDEGSSLWHDVTPVHVADKTVGVGRRELIGFDIKVL